MSRRYLAFPIVLVLMIASVLVIACGDDDGDDEPASPTATAEAAAATNTPSGPAGPTATLEDGEPPTPVAGNRDPVDVPGTAVGTLVDIRAATHEGFDRLVFEFDEAVPGYLVQYVDSEAQCGSGEDVPFAGEAGLRVRLNPANAHDESGESSIDVDPSTLPGQTQEVLQLEQTCDFEAVVAFLIGLTEEEDFSVTALEDPPRVVIDILHPASGAGE